MNRIQLGNKVYNLALSVYIFQAVGVFSSLENKPFLGYLTYLILLLLGIKIILSRYTRPQFLLVVSLLVFGLWLYYITTVGDLMIFIWFIIAARDVNLRRSLRVALSVYIIAVLSGLLLYFFGYAPDNTKKLTDGTIGHSYGFTNANVLSILAFQPVLIWVFLKYKNLRIRDYVLIILTESTLYYFTRCRSAFIASLVILFLLPNIKALSSYKYTKGILSVLAFTSPICAILSFLFVYLYSRGGALVNNIDILGSSRVSSAYMNIFLYGIRFLPVANNPIYSSLYTLDNSYIRIATHFGILVLILVLYIYTRSMYIMFKREEYERLTIMVTICILSLFETNLYRLSINIALLLLSEGLYMSSKLNTTKECESGILYQQEDRRK